LLDDDTEVLMTPVIYTEITNSNYSSGKSPFFKLNDLFIHFSQLPEELIEKNIFKVRFYCLRIDPSDIREIVQAMCPSCKECYSCKDLGESGEGKCTACNVKTRLVYKMQMLVKDASS
jgi:recombinational DNA repair protein RecR